MRLISFLPSNNQNIEDFKILVSKFQSHIQIFFILQPIHESSVHRVRV